MPQRFGHSQPSWKEPGDKDMTSTISTVEMSNVLDYLIGCSSPTGHFMLRHLGYLPKSGDASNLPLMLPDDLECLTHLTERFGVPNCGIPSAKPGKCLSFAHIEREALSERTWLQFEA